MKRYTYLIIVVMLIAAGTIGCKNANNKTKESKTVTEQKTEKYTKNKVSVLYDYYKDESGIWHADGREYAYRVVLTGKLPKASKKSRYVVLSNEKNISFEEAAEDMLSNNSEKQFDKNKAIIVEIQ